MERKVSSSGAPKKMDGMKSKNVWVIAIDAINVAIAIVGRPDNVVIRERISAAIRFMWIPGIRPVIVPAINPKHNAMIISIIMGFKGPPAFDFLLILVATKPDFSFGVFDCSFYHFIDDILFKHCRLIWIPGLIL